MKLKTQKQNKKKVLGLIATGDWHLQASCPAYRTPIADRWVEYQLEVVGNVFEYAKERNEVLLAAGDIFHRPRITSMADFHLLQEFLYLFDCSDVSNRFDARFIPGQHDLPFHSYNELRNSTYGHCSWVYPNAFASHLTISECFDGSSVMISDPEDSEDAIHSISSKIGKYGFRLGFEFTKSKSAPFFVETMRSDDDMFVLWMLPYGTDFALVNSVCQMLIDQDLAWGGLPHVAMIHAGVSPGPLAKSRKTENKNTAGFDYKAGDMIESNTKAPVISKQLPFADLIISGDFHQHFVDGNVVNAGPLTCQNRAQTGLNAWAVYLFDDGSVSAHPLSGLSSIEEDLDFHELYLAQGDDPIPEPSEYMTGLTEAVRDAMLKFVKNAASSAEDLVLGLAKDDPLLHDSLKRAFDHVKK